MRKKINLFLFIFFLFIFFIPVKNILATHSDCSGWPDSGPCNCSATPDGCDGECGGTDGCGECSIDPGGDCVQYNPWSAGKCGPFCVPECFSCDDSQRTNRNECAVTCNHCSNTITCAACPTDVPGPTDEPEPSDKPTRTPTSQTPTITPTPTTVQPTEIITLAPTATPDPSQPAPTGNAVDQRWVCLDEEPCSSSQTCSGLGDPSHRARLFVKEDTKPLANKETYIFECLQLTSGNICTSGDSAIDQQILINDYKTYLENNYGYLFSGFYQADGTSTATLPISSDVNGDIGTFEWESATTDNIGRIFFAVNQVSGGGQSGNEGGQQQASIIYSSENKSCTVIRWDPYGQVFDIDTLKPVAGINVVLYKKNGTEFKIVKPGEVLGGIINPFKSNKNGQYNFFITSGIYKLNIDNADYLIIFKTDKKTEAVKKYKKIYDGGEIIITEKPPLLNIAVQKITIFNHPWLFLRNKFLMVERSFSQI